MGLQLKLRTLDKPFGFLVLKPSGVRFAEVSFQNYLVNWRYMAGIGIRIWFDLAAYIAGVVASRAQWRFGIFAEGRNPHGDPIANMRPIYAYSLIH